MMCLLYGMIRTQIQLTEEQARRLRRAAQREGTSVAEIVRRCVERGLGDELSETAERYARALRVVGKFRDKEGRRDVSVAHDEHLDGAFG